jgi:tripartite-type tricarboxylate transporter receptor subunit TctC
MSRLLHSFTSAAFVAITLFAIESFAQTAYPTKPIRMVNPFPPGGAIDVVGRPVFDRLRGPLGQPVIMDYRAGAGTIIGSELVAKATPDGYTLLATAGQHAINPSVYSKLPYDTLRDFAPVSMLATGPYVVAIHPSVPAANLRALIALAKSRPGKMNFASASPGSGFHMAAEMFKLMTGTDIVHVPYKGGAPATTALLTGEVDMMFSSTAAILPHISSGRIRALAVTTKERFGQLPNVPTIAEAGLPGFEAEAWYGVFAPAATPREIILKLSEAIDRVVKTPEVRQAYAPVGLEPAGGTPQQFNTRFVADIQKWAKVAKASGAKAD